MADYSIDDILAELEAKKKRKSPPAEKAKEAPVAPAPEKAKEAPIAPKPEKAKEAPIAPKPEKAVTEKPVPPLKRAEDISTTAILNGIKAQEDDTEVKTYTPANKQKSEAKPDKPAIISEPVASAKSVKSPKSDTAEVFPDIKAKRDGKWSLFGKKSDLQLSEPDKKVGTAEVKTDKKGNTAEVKTDKKVDTAEVKLDKKGDTAEVKTDKKGNTAEVKLDKKVDTAEVKTDKKGDTAEVKTDKKGDTAEVKTDKKGSTAEVKPYKKGDTAEVKPAAKGFSHHPDLVLRDDALPRKKINISHSLTFSKIDRKVQDKTVAASLGKPKPEPEKKPIKSPEEMELEEKQRLELLKQRERENSDPDDMLDLINPIEVKEKVNEEVKERAESRPNKSVVGNLMRGNTRSLEKSAETVDADGVKEYKVSRTGLIDSINKSLSEQRSKNVKAHRTITLSKGINGGTAPHPLNIDYKKQIAEFTGSTMEENPIVEQEKLEELSANKKRKLKDFVIEDTSEDAYEEEEEREVEEFDDYDSSGQIWADLCTSRKGLKLRAAILTLFTAISVLIGFLNDFDLIGGGQGGNPLNFISVKGDVNSLLYIYLALGILGFVVCSTVLSNGFVKLFTGRADCDSVCAVTAALSLIGGVVALIDLQSFKLMHSYVYISTALAALLFNTIGKLFMISRAMRNFRVISGVGAKYYIQLIENEASVSTLTRAAGDRLPVIATMRKTEFLTDFLKNSYCDDAADRLSVKILIGAGAAGLIAGLLGFFNPFGAQFAYDLGEFENPVFWAVSCIVATVCVTSPFSMLLMVNHPLNLASKALCPSGSALLGYDSAVKFADVNTVMVDAKSLFPAGSVVMHRFKRLQKKNAVVPVGVEDAILMAASIAIHTDGILSYMFYDVTQGDKSLLQKVDNCIYEDNSGVTGWIGTKRVMLGGRQLMETHHVPIPENANEEKYISDGYDVVYLAVSGEVIMMFVVGMLANPEVKDSLHLLAENGVDILVRTTDSIVTEDKLALLFELPAECITILPHDAHEEYEACTRYTSRGNGELSCGGTLSALTRCILAAKKLATEFVFAKGFVIATAALGALLAIIMTMFKQTMFITPSLVTLYNTFNAIVLLSVQKIGKY